MFWSLENVGQLPVLTGAICLNLPNQLLIHRIQMVDLARFCATRCCQWLRQQEDKHLRARKIPNQDFESHKLYLQIAVLRKIMISFFANSKHIRIIEWISLGKDVGNNISSTALMFVQTSWHQKSAALRSHIASTRVTGGEMGNGTVSMHSRLKKLRGFGISNNLVSHCLSVFTVLAPGLCSSKGRSV